VADYEYDGVQPAVGSGKSAGHFLHRETPLFKNHSVAMGNFKN
jgi:hypothetical protein